MAFLPSMQETVFPARQLRLAAQPHLGLNEMARKMKISDAYLVDLEHGRRRWNEKMRLRFLGVLETWRRNPRPTPRKRYTRPGIGPQAATANAK